MLKRLRPLDIDPSTRLVHWYLVFTEIDHAHWWDRWLAPGFRHVYAFRQTPEGWLYINPRTDYTEIALEPYLNDNPANGFQVVSEGPVTVLNVLAAVPKHRLRCRWFVGPVTCVEIIKSLLGIRAFFVFTPRQLYHYARQCNGTIQKAKYTGTERRGRKRQPAAA